MTKTNSIIQQWLKAGGQIQIEWSENTQLYYAEFDEDKPPVDYVGCGSGETPLEALESLIEDANEPGES